MEKRGLVQSNFVDGDNGWIEEKRDEGELTNLRELLSLTEGKSFTTGSQVPSNGALEGFGYFPPAVTMYSLAALVVLIRIF